jgi:hypothetical protein
MKKKMFVLTTLVVSISLALVAGPVSASQTSKWNKWETMTTPVLKSVNAHFTALEHDLNSGDLSASRLELGDLNTDSILMAQRANSPDVRVNVDLLNWSLALGNVSSTGDATLSGGSISAWKSVLSTLVSAEVKFTHDVNKDNNKWK